MGKRDIMRKLLCIGENNDAESEILREKPEQEEDYLEKDGSLLEESHFEREACWCGLSYEDLMEGHGNQGTDTEVAWDGHSSPSSGQPLLRLKEQLERSKRALARVSESSVNMSPQQR